MATVLVVDDIAANRELIVTLLAYQGHETIEAADGAEALTLVRAQRPALVISDILMPTMDGFEFVRQLRADADIAGTEVIFYTAHYHQLEAHNLAAACGVSYVLVKPCEPEEILRVVSAALARAPAAGAAHITPHFQRDHLRLMTDQLSRETAQLQSTCSRLTALSELNVHLASEHDPVRLLQEVCKRARELLGARYSVLTVVPPAAARMQFFTSGISVAKAITPPEIAAGPLQGVFTGGTALRLSGLSGDPRAAGLPPDYPPVHAALAVPIASLSAIYGWICLADKLGSSEFTDEDERLLKTLGAQVGRIYENGELYRQVQRHSEQLSMEMEERERAVVELLASEERFRQLAEHIEDVFYIASPDFAQLHYLSPAYERIWGRPRSAAYENALVWTDSIHPGDRARVFAGLHASSRSKTMSEFEYRVVRPDYSFRWVLARTYPIFDAAGNAVRMVGIATDITQRREAQEEIGHLNRVHAMLSGINGLIVRANDRGALFTAACRLAVDQGRFKLAWIGTYDAGSGEITIVAQSGVAPANPQTPWPRVGDTAQPDPLLSAALGSQQASYCNDLQVPAARATLYRSALLQYSCNGLAILPLAVNGQSVGCFVLVTEELQFFTEAEMHLLRELAGDVSFALDHLEKEDRLNYLAYYDALTGLANRAFFTERLIQYVNAAHRAGSRFALVIADMRRFDAINESLGRNVGDLVLKQVAKRFAECVGSINEVARIGPNQFAAVILDVREDGEVARKVHDWKLRWLGEPFRIAENELRLSANSGIAVFPPDGTDAVTLLRNAETALHKAKSTEESNLFYTQHLRTRVSEELALEHELRQALVHDEFVLYYQPKVDVESRRVKGIEALIRWQSPTRGLVPPGKFIPIMENTGLIVEVGEWVLRRATLDRARWSEQGVEAPRVAVNVSTVQLRKQDFVKTLQQILNGRGREAGIDIEVTESLIVEDVGGNIEKLRAVRDLGVDIAIDDFGTGYSSLSYLAKLPVALLKIDRSFIIAMLDDPGVMTLVSTMISLAHSLKLVVVAEGVESEEQAKILRLLRCDLIQGYLVSKPMPFDDMTTYLRQGGG
jgi:diguanylate cyclase (GGDEF)-like protein/PAS domain S-box-containing protein